jgi:putative ABC transport system permease protein
MGWMSLSDILFLYRARLGARAVLVQEGFAVVGIAVGVALLFASQVASTSLARSVQDLTREVVGDTQLQIDARGADGVSERLLREVQRVPGVQAALPVLEQQVNVVGPGGQRSVDLIGADPRFARLGGSLLRRFTARQLAAQRVITLPTSIAEGIGVAPLQTVKLQIGAGVVEALLGTTLSEAEVGGLADSPIAVAPIAYAQQLTGLTGRVTRIYVRVQPQRMAAARRSLGRLAAAAGANLVPATFDSTLFGVASTPEDQGEALLSAISAIVGFMFALNAMLITVPLRRRLIEDLRPAGATDTIVAQILLFDAAVLGVSACALGLVLGELLSIVAFHATPGYLTSAFPVGDERIVTWQSVALAVGAGLAAACAGVLWPLRDALIRSARPGEEQSRAPRRWASARLPVGCACLAFTTVILVLRPQDAFVATIALVAALLCLLPSLFDGVVRAFEHGQRLLDGAATVLSVTALQTPQTRVRALAIATTGAIAVFGAVAVGGAQVNLQHGLDASARQIDGGADVWVSPGGESSLLTTIPFRAIDTAALTRLPGVGAVGVYRGGFLNWGDRRLWVLAPPNSSGQPIPPSQLLTGSLAQAVAHIRGGGWAVISQALASEHHLGVGQSFVLPAPNPTRLRVAALSTNLGWPPGAIILGSGEYARAWGSSEPSAYEIQTKPGASPASVRRLVQHALGPATGLTVETVAERTRRHYTLVRQGLARLVQIRLLVLLAGALAVAGALGSMIWQRRSLVAFIKCQGFQRGVLWRWLLCESAVLLIAGCAIGCLFGLYGQLLISHALGSVTGLPTSLDIEAIVAASSFALVSAVAVASVALPGYLVVRVPPSTVSAAY